MNQPPHELQDRFFLITEQTYGFNDDCCRQDQQQHDDDCARNGGKIQDEARAGIQESDEINKNDAFHMRISERSHPVVDMVSVRFYE